jgi:isopentenyl-diphosphate delta-isomerase type 1
MVEQVILVDKTDQEIGVCEKIAAHRQGILHRAFSIFLYRKINNKIEILLQERHPDKYHCGGLWTNACCSHPRPGEDLLSAAKRRLIEELGIYNVELEVLDSFIYRAEFANGLIEHEFDHVLLGEYQDFPIKPNWDEEISAIKWIELNILKNQIDQYPTRFTPWLLQGLNKIIIK